MRPWFIATERFTPDDAEAWAKYIAWSGLTQLDEVVSLDGLLCPHVLSEIKHEYWPHIVNDDVRFFTDFAFLAGQISGIPKRNLLGVYRNPAIPPPSPGPVSFEFLGYDLVEVQGSISALSNCGGFPDVFDNAELSSKGLLTSHARALEVQSHLRLKHPEDPHADCHMWAIFRAVGEPIRQPRA